MDSSLAVYCVTPTYTIREALNQIEENRSRGVFVIGNGDRVEGFLSQGDIIRALCVGADIYSSIRHFSSPSFLYLKDRDMDKAFGLLKERGMTLFPVVDDDFKLIDVITLFDIMEYIDRRLSNG